MAKVVFLFPGQGAQKVGMGKALHDGLPAAKRLFDEAAEVLGYSLADVCFNGPADRLNSTAVSQPALYVCSLAALEQLKVNEPQALDECFATAGLSLGEYTALAFAGALTFRDGLKLVQKRGEAMQQAADATPSGMVAIIGMDEPAVRELVNAARPGGSVLEIANLLCPGNIVVSGSAAACEAFDKLATEKGAKTIKLTVAGAFHTSIMKPADDKLADALKAVDVRSPRVPVWSNVDARPHTDPGEIRRLLVQQVVSPVLMEKSLRGLLESGAERFYEIGPGTVVSGLLKRILRKADIRQVPA
jgi:[acyl-carrier-protein] S-malonyltransferase